MVGCHNIPSLFSETAWLQKLFPTIDGANKFLGGRREFSVGKTSLKYEARLRGAFIDSVRDACNNLTETLSDKPYSPAFF
jgi:hypothetical protein